MRKLFRKREFNFNFLKADKIFYALSVLMVLISLVSFFARGMNYGIDFEGGVQIVASSSEQIKLDTVRERLSRQNKSSDDEASGYSGRSAGCI